ncbi:MAG: spermidine resistance protein [Candelina mexicana]|nr:MAG: spermidine resistance protein [Candelina mexicana]
MVNLAIPYNYTASPSSFSGTPHLTINREATIELDSKNAFEGPEKLLEVWFSASPDALPGTTANNGLKAVPAELWKEMLDLVNCKVLSVIESEHVDAYLLSESSMFVFPHKLILKTCGTTTLLCGLPRMLEIAALSAGFPHVIANPLKGIPAAATPYRVFYSRKNFLYPDKQHGPHRSWRDEVRTLDRMFLGGSAYMIGKMNGEHWYLYLTSPGTVLTPPATPTSQTSEVVETDIRFLHFPSGCATDMSTADGCGEDETLELLMTDLDERNAKQFYLDHASAVAEGQYFDEAHRALQSARDSLGEINGNKTQSSDEEVDVFSNTSSDGGDLLSSHNEPTFPEEMTTEGHALGTVVSESSGLSEVYPISQYPDARIDAYLFTPCGFSANGVVPAQSRSDNSSSVHYFTVHVTPEPHCSYASFETNVPSRQSGRETAEVIEQVVNIFKPGRFSVTLFEAKPDIGDTGLSAQNEFMREMKNATKRSSRMEAIKGYRRVDRIVHDLDGYDLVFRYYERYDWKGGAPRIGEIGF